MPLALVTGGAKRIGAAIALVLAEAGFDIALHVNSSMEEGAALVKILRQKNIDAQLFSLDLSNTTHIKSLFAKINKAMGPIDLAVNNASLFGYDSPQDFDPDLARRQFAVNLLAPVEITRCMAENQAGEPLVVNMLDNKLFSLNPDYFSYTISKAALKNAAQMMAMGYAGKLRINAIAPGVTLISGSQSQENFEKGWQKSLSGTGATPNDIADTILHLWNTKSINGETIILDGGQHLMGLDRDVAFLTDEVNG